MWLLPLLILLLMYAIAAAKSPEILFYGGCFCVGAGFVTGVPIAILYHVQLFRLVFPVNPKAITRLQWVVDPRRLYPDVPEHAVEPLNGLFTLMIRCWLVAMGGCLLVVFWLLALFLSE